MKERKISKKELEKILKNHSLWLKSKGEKGERADFSHCWLYGLDEDGNEEKLNLEGAVLDYADFSFAILTEVKLYRTSLKHTDFTGASFDGRMKLYGTNFSFAKLVDTNFHQADITSVSFESADLRGARFDRSSLDLVNFDFADLRGASFNGTRLSYTAFGEANVKDAWFTSLELNGYSMKMHIDDEQAQKMMYFVLKLIEHSKNISKETKDICKIKKIVDFANKCDWAEDDAVRLIKK